MPAEQAEQGSEPTWADDPGLQGWQELLPVEGLAYPAGQGAHADNPITSANVPAAQGEQAVAEKAAL